MNYAGKLGNRKYLTKLQPIWRISHYIVLMDLFFLILFFLLMATSVVRISGIRVNLPQANVPRAAGLGKAIVTIVPPLESGMECRIYFRDRHISSDQLRRELLADARREKFLIIRADKDVPSGVTADIMAIAESAGMKSFIAIQPLAEQTETRFE